MGLIEACFQLCSNLINLQLILHCSDFKPKVLCNVSTIDWSKTVARAAESDLKESGERQTGKSQISAQFPFRPTPSKATVVIPFLKLLRGGTQNSEGDRE